MSTIKKNVSWNNEKTSELNAVLWHSLTSENQRKEQTKSVFSSEVFLWFQKCRS